MIEQKKKLMPKQKPAGYDREIQRVAEQYKKLRQNQQPDRKQVIPQRPAPRPPQYHNYGAPYNHYDEIMRIERQRREILERKKLAQREQDERRRIYFEARNAAMRNKQRAILEERRNNFFGQYEPSPPRVEHKPNKKAPQFTEQQMAELRKNAYWEMRRAAERNKRRINQELYELKPLSEQEKYDYMLDKVLHGKPDHLDIFTGRGNHQPTHAVHDLKKFRLDGSTLKLPNVSERDSLCYRIESLRMYMEKELGCDKFSAAYKIIESQNEHTDDDLVTQKLISILGKEKMGYVSLMYQLLFCEDRFNDHQFNK